MVISIVIFRHAPAPDPLLTSHYYERSSEQNEKMGYIAGPPQSNPTNEPSESVAQEFNAVSSADIPINTNSVNRGVRYSPAGTRRALPHGSVGARSLYDNRRSIAAASGSEFGSVGFYSAPEEV